MHVGVFITKRQTCTNFKIMHESTSLVHLCAIHFTIRIFLVDFLGNERISDSDSDVQPLKRSFTCPSLTYSRFAYVCSKDLQGSLRLRKRRARRNVTVVIIPLREMRPTMLSTMARMILRQESRKTLRPRSGIGRRRTSRGVLVCVQIQQKLQIVERGNRCDL